MIKIVSAFDKRLQNDGVVKDGFKLFNVIYIM